MINLIQNTELMTNLTCSTGSVYPVLAIAIPRSNDAAVTPSVIGDANINTNTSATGWNDYLLEVAENKSATFTTLIPGSCTITGHTIERTNSDSTIIQCEIEGQRGVTIIPLDLTLSTSFTYNTFVSYVTGSVAKYITDQVTPLLVEGKDINLFSVINHGTATYTKNTNCWIYGLDTSAVAVASSNNGTTWFTQHGGVLITPRHVEEAAHFETTIGGKKRFLTTSGVVVEKTIIGAVNFSDIRILLLDSDVDGITPMPVADSWLSPTISLTYNGPQVIDTFYAGGLGIMVDQDRNFGVCRFGLSPSDVSRSNAVNGYIGEQTFTNLRLNEYVNNGGQLNTDPYLTGKLEFTFDAAEGDSGSPAMIVVDGDLVLVTHFWYSTAGPYLTPAVLNAMIFLVDETYEVSTEHTVTVAPDPTI